VYEFILIRAFSMYCLSQFRNPQSPGGGRGALNWQIPDKYAK
jgi:hypothetical protein